MAAPKFVVEFTEDGVRQTEIVEVGNVENADRAKAEPIIQKIWSRAMPERSDVKIVSVVGAGTVRPLTSSTAGDAKIAEKMLKKLEGGDSK